MTQRAESFVKKRAEILSGPNEQENKLEAFYTAQQTDGRPLDIIAVPDDCNNNGFADHWLDKKHTGWLPENVDYPTIEEGTIIAGIIDIDIAFGHRRFRDKTGRSRILASWQQGADRASGNAGGHLPFGRDLLSQDINELLISHSANGDLTSALDQDSFNQEAGLIAYTRVAGPKGILRSNAHGTHVLGLMGGADPFENPEFGDRVKLIVVNLPSPVVYAEGGALLDGYLIYAYNWLAAVFEKIVKKSNLQLQDVPFVSNISFGKQAGAKGDIQGFPATLFEMEDRFRQEKSSTFSTMLPSGNDNLTRSHAIMELKPGSNNIGEIEWRVVPDDQTSNFLEIWVHDQPLERETPPIEIDIVPPNTDPKGFSRGLPGQVCDLLSGLGRIYCETTRSHRLDRRNFLYQVCLAPDTVPEILGGGATAGKWRIRVKNTSSENITVRLMIQTDQSTLPGERITRRSYFDDQKYTLIEWSGRTADTYVYSSRAERPANLDNRGFILRHGSMNSYAGTNGTATVAGFRFSDGRPAPYSASGLGRRAHLDARGAPTVALPSDDGYAHFGVLSDGAYDGSVAAMRGTSFACADATRQVIEAWLGDILKGLRPTLPAHRLFEKRAEIEKADEGRLYYQADIEKVGRGRIRSRNRLRSLRMTNSE
ncbi:hypothetical protein J7400_17705 [Shimia sp. R9_2]|uniref:hypothetical protein n=1 Tax=Shimia sp. R9_2 TaxID=2821112 RepID=UPI001AD9ADA2|nr:hypothetical protein [Shimia sp. R9_2]MBO9398511.1 hypothetical protein [Shimia sp. R9_2]